MCQFFIILEQVAVQAVVASTAIINACRAVSSAPISLIVLELQSLWRFACFADSIHNITLTFTFVRLDVETTIIFVIILCILRVHTIRSIIVILFRLVTVDPLVIRVVLVEVDLSVSIAFIALIARLVYQAAWLLHTFCAARLRHADEVQLV